MRSSPCPCRPRHREGCPPHGWRRRSGMGDLSTVAGAGRCFGLDMASRRRPRCAAGAVGRAFRGLGFPRSAGAELIESDPAEVNGRVIPDDLVTAAARALGLVDATPPPAGRFSAVLVLSGLVSACVNRTRRTAGLLDEGLDTRTVAVLGGHRKLGGREPDQARELGFGELFDEADALLAATRSAFGLGEPEISERSGPRLAEWDDSLWAASGRYRWAAAGQGPGIEVLIVPSADPAKRRVNTADQLKDWAEGAGIRAADRVLLVTTQIYVPFQQFDGLRKLGLDRGCAVACCGVDAGTAYLPMKDFGGRSYLQEVRSALLAASDLLAAARQERH